MADIEKPNVQEVNYPRHILLVGPPDAGILQLLKELTGLAPTPRHVPSARTRDDDIQSSNYSNASPARTTIAGLNHELELCTKYYKATVPIWIDEAADPTTWKKDFLSSEASEVVKAVGAWIVVFRKTAAGWQIARELMTAIRDAVSHVYGGEGVWDGVFLCVGMPSAQDAVPRGEAAMGTGYEEWEDECFELAFELIDGEITGEDAKKRNAAGELRGTARLMEALEANEWEHVDDLDESTLGLVDDADLDTGLQPGHGFAKDETPGFRLERAQMEREFAGLKMAMAGDDIAEDDDGELQEQQVEEVERMMLKAHAVRDMSSHLPEQERKRLAKKTVDELMRDLT